MANFSVGQYELDSKRLYDSEWVQGFFRNIVDGMVTRQYSRDNILPPIVVRATPCWSTTIILVPAAKHHEKTMASHESWPLPNRASLGHDRETCMSTSKATATFAELGWALLLEWSPSNCHCEIDLDHATPHKLK